MVFLNLRIPFCDNTDFWIKTFNDIMDKPKREQLDYLKANGFNDIIKYVKVSNEDIYVEPELRKYAISIDEFNSFSNTQSLNNYLTFKDIVNDIGWEKIDQYFNSIIYVGTDQKIYPKLPAGYIYLKLILLIIVI